MKKWNEIVMEAKEVYNASTIEKEIFIFGERVILKDDKFLYKSMRSAQSSKIHKDIMKSLMYGEEPVLPFKLDKNRKVMSIGAKAYKDGWVVFVETVLRK